MVEILIKAIKKSNRLAIPDIDDSIQTYFHMLCMFKFRKPYHYITVKGWKV